MRKLSLLVMLMFAFGYVFSQNISDVNQTGAQQDADVSQVGNNTSVINQLNDWTDPSGNFIQISDVIQNGSSTSNISQKSVSSSGTKAGIQNAEVKQYIGANTSDINQSSENQGPLDAYVYQRGTGNEADVDQYQTGGGNAVLMSTMAEQIGNHNYIKQYEYAPGSNGNQKEWSWQDGNSNWGRQQIVSGYTEKLFLEQKGDNNWSDQYMKGGGHNRGEVNSTGNNNWAKQYVDGTNWDAMIDQDGNYNITDQNLNGGGSSIDNIAYVRQNGNRNEGNQYMSVYNSTASIKQIGNRNDGQVTYNPWIPVFGWNIMPYFNPYWTQYQVSDNSYLGIEAYGSHNHTAQYQEGTATGSTGAASVDDYNSATIFIVGDYNNSAQYQKGYELEAEVDIYGNGNYGMTEQLGHENFADINIGKNGNNPVDGNCAGIYQNGDNLSAVINQFSNNNWSRVKQNSYGSQVDVTQR